MGEIEEVQEQMKADMEALKDKMRPQLPEANFQIPLKIHSWPAATQASLLRGLCSFIG